MEVKELTKRQTILKIKKLLNAKRYIAPNDFKAGNLFLMQYSAKDKTKIFDRVPLMLILATNESHTLGLNFHWIPFKMRIWLIRYIIKLNKTRIKQGKRIKFEYRKIKPMLKKLKYAPCIRLYIRKRISKKGVVIPPERLIEVAQLKTDFFTGGLTSKQVYDLAKRKKI